MPLKIDSAPGSDGIPCGAYWCAGGLGSQFFFNASKYLLEGGTVPEHFAVCAPDKATLKAETHALQCTTAGPYNAFPSNLLGVGSVCGLGPDIVGVHSISLAARYRTAACSNTRGHNFAPIFSFSPVWEKECLAPCMACSTADAFNIVCSLDRDGKLDEAPQDKKQKVDSGLLSDKVCEQDFCWASF